MNFPQPVNMKNPYTPDPVNYEDRYSKIGSKIANVAEDAGGLWDKIRAYELLQEKMKDDNTFRAGLLSEVNELMVENGYSPQNIASTTHLIMKGDKEEAHQKAIAFKDAIGYMKEQNLDIMPMFGEGKYRERVLPMVNKKETAAQTEAAKAGTGYGEQANLAVNAGKGPMTADTKFALEAGQKEKEALAKQSFNQKKLALQKAKDDAVLAHQKAMRKIAEDKLTGKSGNNSALLTRVYGLREEYISLLSGSDQYTMDPREKKAIEQDLGDLDAIIDELRPKREGGTVYGANSTYQPPSPKPEEPGLIQRGVNYVTGGGNSAEAPSPAAAGGASGPIQGAPTPVVPAPSGVKKTSTGAKWSIKK